jgi:hypothetical protein
MYGAGQESIDVQMAREDFVVRRHGNDQDRPSMRSRRQESRESSGWDTNPVSALQSQQLFAAKNGQTEFSQAA